MSGTSTTITAEEAAQRAKEIAARLSGLTPLPLPSSSSSSLVDESSSQQQQVSSEGITSENGHANGNSDNNNNTNEVNGSDGDTEEGVNNSSSNNTNNVDPTTTDSSASSSKKRKRWGIMPPDTTNSTIGTNTTGLPIDPAAESRAKALAAIAKAIAAPAAGGTTTTSSSLSNTLMLVGNTVVSKPPPKVPPITKRVWVDAASHSMLTTERPAAHFVAYTNRFIPELVDKLNKSVAKPSTVDDSTTTPTTIPPSDQDDDDLLTIEFKGRGANDRPPILGMPEEPLHVFIRGPKLIAEQAEYEIQDLLEQAKTSPIEEDAINARLAAEGALTTTSSASIQPIQSTTHYRPASVAQLIGQANMPYEHRLAQLQNDSLQTSQLEEIIGVPNGIVGYIIGRGGENIASMQAKTGVKVQIQKEHELAPGTTERQITLQAHSQEALNACRTIIENMVAERIRVLSNNNNSNNNNNGSNNNGSNYMSKPGLGYNNNNNSTMMNGGNQMNPAMGGIDNNKPDPVQAALALGHQLVEVDVPDADVGLVIGKGGATIKMIQEQTGASIQVPKTGNADNPLIRTLNITCPQLHGAQRAKEMVEDVLKTKPGYQQQMRLLQQQGAQMAQGGQHQQQPTDVSVMVNIPDKDVGLCIGKQGIVIKYMQNTTQTKIQIPPTVANHGDTYRTATILGPTLDACNQVKSIIERIVAEQSSQWIMAAAQNLQYNNQQQQSYGGQGYSNQYDAGVGGAYQQQSHYNQQHYDPNQQQQQQQQQGYSAEWAAYHAAVAAQQQLQVQQQYPNAAAAAPASTTPVVTAAAASQQQQQPTSADAYYEQFFRYAYYYGDDAARQYYGAWAPPVGTPNPYGVNPNIQAAPTAAATSAVAAAPVTTSVNIENGAYSQDSAADLRETSRRQVSNLPAWMTKK